jgi:hypothetical protein
MRRAMYLIFPTKDLSLESVSKPWKNYLTFISNQNKSNS